MGERDGQVSKSQIAGRGVPASVGWVGRGDVSSGR